MPRVVLLLLFVIAPALHAQEEPPSRLSFRAIVEPGYAAQDHPGVDFGGGVFAAGAHMTYALGERPGSAGAFVLTATRETELLFTDGDPERYEAQPGGFFSFGGLCRDREAERGESDLVFGILCSGGTVLLGRTSLEAGYQLPFPIPLSVGTGAYLGSRVGEDGFLDLGVRPYVQTRVSLPISGRLDVNGYGRYGREVRQIRAGLAIRVR